MILAIQLVEPFAEAKTAQAAFDQLEEQDGFLGGRVLTPSPSEPDWRVQAFFKDEDKPGAIGTAPDEWLPDGCRRVVIPDSIAGVLGIES